MQSAVVSDPIAGSTTSGRAGSTGSDDLTGTIELKYASYVLLLHYGGLLM